MDNKGFSLIEIMISTMIVSAITVSIFSLLVYSLNITADNKLRMAALMIAEQKMEYIRSLPYDDVATLGGMPAGAIPQNETVTRNGSFGVNTYIKFIDDVYDGLVDDTPSDTLSNDYKLVRIIVSWNGPLGTKSITAFTNIAPRGIETNIGGGTLEISVFNASGTPVSFADVHIENNNVTPAINLDDQTNAYGILSFPGATTSMESYEITVTKGLTYSADYTSERNAVNQNPTKPHASVIEDQKTEISFAIDLLSDLTIQTLTADLPHQWQAAKDPTADQTNSRIVIDSAGYVYSVWQDYRQTGKPKILAQKYDSDGNEQWSDDVIIATAADTVLPDIKIDAAGNLYAVWHDEAVGDRQVYIIKLSSSDGSTVWGGSKITTDSVNKNQENIRLTLLDKNSKATSTVVWQDDRNGNWDLYIQQFDYDNGNYIFSTGNPISETEIKANDTSDNTNQTDPAIASDSDDNFYVAWADDRDGDLNIYWEKFSSLGIPQWGNTKITTNVSNQYSPEIAIDSSDNIYISWTDEQNGDSDIYTQKFDTSGNEIWSDPLQVNTDETSTHQYSSSLVTDSAGDIYYVWTDERNDNLDIYGQKFNSSGVSYWSDDVRANLNIGDSDEYNPYITMDPTDNTPYVSWQSDKSGDLNIYICAFGKITGEAIEANVPFTLHGEKQIGDNPVIYKFNETYANTTGTVILNDIEWDSYTATTTRTIIFTDPPMPLYLEPNTSQTLKIYVE